MADMLDIIMNLECLKCGTRENLMPYNVSHSEVINSRRINKRTREVTYKVHSIPVPICVLCQNEFKKWNRGKKLLIVLGVVGFFLFWPGLILLLLNIALGANEPIFLQLLALVLGTILIIVALILYIFHRKKDSNPNNYMSMGSDLVPYVKPKNQGWLKYEDWLRSFSAKQILPPNVSYPEKQINNDIKSSYTTDKFDMIIYQYLRQNVGKAFTEKALISRIMKKISNESDKEYLINNIENILNRLALQKRINKVQRNGQFYYSVA